VHSLRNYNKTRCQIFYLQTFDLFIIGQNTRLLLVTPRLHLVKRMQTNIKIVGICFKKQIRVFLRYLPSLKNEDRKMVFVRAYHLATYIFLSFHLLNEPRLGTIIDPGMVLTPFPSSTRQEI